MKNRYMGPLAILTLIFSIVAIPDGTLAADEVDFSHAIAPLLMERCVDCHGGTNREGAYSINDRRSAISGGESGPAIVVGDHMASELYRRVSSDDPDLRMPPDGDRLTDDQLRTLANWIDSGVDWEAGLTFGADAYQPALLPRLPDLPPAVGDRNHPIDRIIDHAVRSSGRALPEGISDDVFLRRVYLDLIGLLPTPDQLAAFRDDSDSDKRQKLIRELLDRQVEYAEHWLTFWNDLLRNDYAGTGFITGGRRQITQWLYDALVDNMPYDQFVRELIAPPDASSEGFAAGIRWRGEVSAGQTVEIQFAQNVGQVFLGINLKCASCHDSFVDQWKLEDAYGLAAVYAQQPLELHRCDKPLGKHATAAWLFDDLGQIDPTASQPERLRRLAELMTHRDNGRFTRTIVNRLWQRMMGRGIVHPTDAMQTEPWNQDLLDYLAEYLARNEYDLKRVLEFIATSQAYQSRVESIASSDLDADYQYDGPRAKRMTAEQFIDTVWQLTDAAPRSFDADVIRAPRTDRSPEAPSLRGRWLWSGADYQSAAPKASVTFRRVFELEQGVDQIAAVIACDNQYSMYVNGAKVATGDDWSRPDLVLITNVKPGENELLVVGGNGGSEPNPAAMYFEARWSTADSQVHTLASDADWQWTSRVPDEAGSFGADPVTWQPAYVIGEDQIWASTVESQLANLLRRGLSAERLMVRAALLKSDFLMRSLGRPNRDQVVSVRPAELTTLEAINLSIGETLADYLNRGAKKLVADDSIDASELVTSIFHRALSRDPTPEELQLLSRAVGETASESTVEDVLWAVIMLPEFQFVR
jgi:hypothetical protein